MVTFRLPLVPLVPSKNACSGGACGHCCTGNGNTMAPANNQAILMGWQAVCLPDSPASFLDSKFKLPVIWSGYEYAASLCKSTRSEYCTRYRTRNTRTRIMPQ